jgi:hypothetical protein
MKPKPKHLNSHLILIKQLWRPRCSHVDLTWDEIINIIWFFYFQTLSMWSSWGSWIRMVWFASWPKTSWTGPPLDQRCHQEKIDVILWWIIIRLIFLALGQCLTHKPLRWLSQQEKVVFVTWKVVALDIYLRYAMWFHPLERTICDVYCGI